jgi:hypothetical protein
MTLKKKENYTNYLDVDYALFNLGSIFRKKILVEFSKRNSAVKSVRKINFSKNFRERLLRNKKIYAIRPVNPMLKCRSNFSGSWKKGFFVKRKKVSFLLMWKSNHVVSQTEWTTNDHLCNCLRFIFSRSTQIRGFRKKDLFIFELSTSALF